MKFSTKDIVIICATVVLCVVLYLIGTQYVAGPNAGVYSRLTGQWK